MKRHLLYILLSLLLCFAGCTRADWLDEILTIREAINEGRAIIYTSIDESVVTPKNSNSFGANIVSNTYENGKGVIVFDGVVTSIGDYAFRYCTSLTSITIPDSVTSIGRDAFDDCDSLTSITIPANVTSIGDGAFEDCDSLTSITIPDSVTSIGAGAISGCTSLKSIYGKYASNDGRCLIIDGVLNSFAPAGLTEYTIPDSVTKIGESAFEDCSSLTSITIPDSVTSIGEYAFSYCTSLTSITIPDSVTSLGQKAIAYCTNLQKVYISKNINTWGFSMFEGSAGNLYYDGYMPNFDKEEAGLFYGSEFEKVEFAEGITTIGIDAFSNCANLTSVTIPDSVTSIGQGAFYYCTSLTSVTIPDSVTSIGSGAFFFCTSLTSVYCEPTTPPTGGYHMFSYHNGEYVPIGCKIYVPTESVDAYKSAYYWSDHADYIEPYNFGGGEGLVVTENMKIYYTSTDGEVVTPYDTDGFGANIVSNTYEDGKGVITFDGDVTSIQFRAFYECSSLTSITIPDSVTSIGSAAFCCTSLTSINIPDSVTSIGNYAFADCWSLASVSIGNGVTEIGEGAFSYCKSLASVTIPDSVTSIGNLAFDKCSSLASVSIGNGVTEIGYAAFDSCSSLTSVTIPDSVTSIGYRAFYNCTSLTSVYCKATTPPAGESDMFDYNASGRKIYVPTESVDAYKAAKGWSTYADYIEPYNFGGGEEDGDLPPANEIWYTSTDGEVVIPNATDVFGANIVSNTYEDGKGVITFDGDVTSIGDQAFYNCSSLASVTIPDSVTSIGWSAFYYCTSLTSVTIPDSVIEIGRIAFSGCTSLTSFYGKYASEDGRCLIVDGTLNSFAPAGLTEYTIPDSVTSIGDGAFDDCTSLTSVTIPDSVIEIVRSAFSDCTSLTSITIPDSVTSIGDRAFLGCTSLTSFCCKYASEDGRCLIIDGTLNSFAPAGLTEYTIPDSVTSIGDYAFFACTSLTSITIPDSVTSIGDYAFRYCTSLTSVTIGNGVTEIGQAAFYDCTSLTSVYCKATTPPTGGSGMFSYNASGRKIYVPTESVDAYKAAEGWSGYADYIEPYNFGGGEELVVTENMKIYYTSDDGEVVTPNATDVFGANIVSNTYEDGKGVITFDGDVTSIGDLAFHECSSLTSITIGNGVTSIGWSAFYYCTSLTSVTIPDSVIEIGRIAFSGCTSLTSITIPDSVTSIEYGTFSGCSSLKSIYGKYASEDGRCLIVDGTLNSFAPAGLTEYTIPDSVTSIGDYAFRYFTSLTSITIPDGVTEIGKEAFYKCSSLTSITIPDGVTSIGRYAFRNCTSLTSITIPDSVTSIGDEAFSWCTSLTSVYCKATTPPTGDYYMFNNNASERKIYVPTESVDAYKAAKGWSDYADAIVPYEFE